MKGLIAGLVAGALIATAGVAPAGQTRCERLLEKLRDSNLDARAYVNEGLDAETESDRRTALKAAIAKIDEVREYRTEIKRKCF